MTFTWGYQKSLVKVSFITWERLGGEIKQTWLYLLYSGLYSFIYTVAMWVGALSKYTIWKVMWHIFMNTEGKYEWKFRSYPPTEPCLSWNLKSILSPLPLFSSFTSVILFVLEQFSQTWAPLFVDVWWTCVRSWEADSAPTENTTHENKRLKSKNCTQKYMVNPNIGLLCMCCVSICFAAER